MAGRVRRPKDKEELLDRLVDNSPFDTRYRALTFAAALGFASDRRVALGEVDPAVSIRWELFREVGTDLLAAMIAALDTDEMEIVAPDRVEARIEIFEEYANGGLEILGEELAARAPKGPREVVLDLVLEAEQAASPGEIDLGVLAEEWGTT